jgi:hypothetical protein
MAGRRRLLLLESLFRLLIKFLLLLLRSSVHKDSESGGLSDDGRGAVSVIMSFSFYLSFMCIYHTDKIHEWKWSG